MPKSEPLCIQEVVSPLLNVTLDMWLIVTLFKSVTYSRLYITLNNIKARYILARTVTYSKVVYNRIFLYCPLTVGDRTFFKVTGVAKQRIPFRSNVFRSYYIYQHYKRVIKGGMLLLLYLATYSHLASPEIRVPFLTWSSGCYHHKRHMHLLLTLT